MVNCMLNFIKSLREPALRFINSTNLEFYVKFSMEDFIDDYEDERRSNPMRLGGIEGAHYTLLYLFDTLQFLF